MSTDGKVLIQMSSLLLLGPFHPLRLDLIRDTQSIQEKIIDTTNVRLSLAADIANAAWLATVAYLCFVAGLVSSIRAKDSFLNSPISIHVVVKGDLLIVMYIPLGEDTHPQPPPYNPFLDFTVGVTRVICKSADPTLLRGIDVLNKSACVAATAGIC